MDAPRTESSPASPAALNEWFAVEVHPHESHLRSYLRRAFPTVRDVDDVVQESYLRLWRKQRAQPMESARAFLFRIARNFAIDLLREDRRAPAADLGISGVETVVDDGAETLEQIRARELEEILTDALDALTARHRQIVTLCKLQCLPHAAVAARLGISEKTVNEHLYRGLQRLGDELRRRGVKAGHF